MDPLKMYFLLESGDISILMLVYQGVRHGEPWGFTVKVF